MEILGRFRVNILFTVLFTLMILFGLSGQVHAEQEGDWEYSVQNGHATITRYTGSETNVVIPDTLKGNKVTILGKSCFINCDNIVSVSIPTTVTEIGYGAFVDCNSLKNVEIPNSVSIIGDYAFMSCIGLTDITIPEGVACIGRYSFDMAYNLKSITFKSAGTIIPDDRSFIGNKVKIIGYNGSWAQDYAEKYGNPFELIKDHKKAIIVLPGFMGSKLFGSSFKTVWVDENEIRSDIAKNQIGQSQFSRNSDGSGKLSELTTSLADDQDGIGYGTLMDKLKQYCSNDYDILFYPYNWAGDLNDSVSDLEYQIDSSDYDQITFVTHSTGGLLAAAYIASSDENKNKIDKVMMIAAPLYGTYDSYNAIETGSHPMLEEKINDMKKNDQSPAKIWASIQAVMVSDWAKNALRNSPTAYQLFPSNQYLVQLPIIIKDSSGKSKQIMTINQLSTELSTSGDPNMNYNLLNGNMRSAQYFRDNTLHGDVVDSLKKVDTLLIGSSDCKKDTCFAVGYQKNFLGKPDLKDYWYSNLGDGTVYFKSAFGLKKDNIYRLNYADFRKYKYNHNELISKEPVLDLIISEINKQGSTQSYGIIEPTDALSTASDDVGMADQIKYNIQCDKPYNLKITDVNNTVIASVIDGFYTCVDENQFTYKVLISSETENAAVLYVPNTGVNVSFYSGDTMGSTVNFSAEVSTLDSDGYDSATSTYTANTTGEEGLILTFNQLNILVDKTNIGNLIENQITNPLIKPTDWSIPESTKLELNEVKEVEVIGTEASVAKNHLEWTTSDESVVTTSPTGELTANGYGEATISATDGNKVATSQVVVKCQPGTVDLSDFEVYVGKRNLPVPVFSPSETTETNMSYQTDNTDIISIAENGVVIGLKEGVATVIGTTDNGISDTFTVTVKADRLLHGISMSKSTLDLTTDGTESLTVLYNPENTTDDISVAWGTRDESIAKVDNYGNVTGVGIGQTVIIANVGSFNAICTVTVKDATLLGDVDGNGQIQAFDALMALQIATGKKTGTAAEIKAANVNDIEGVQAYDALKILQYATGKIKEF